MLGQAFKPKLYSRAITARSHAEARALQLRPRIPNTLDRSKALLCVTVNSVRASLFSVCDLRTAVTPSITSRAWATLQFPYRDSY